LENYLKNNRLIYLPYDKKGIFIERKNKFLGLIEFNKKILEAHIHDPGRLENILFKGNEILFNLIDNEKRKTKYEILFGKYKNHYVLINSKFHNKIAEKLIINGKVDEIKNIKSIKREFRIDNSRLDFLVINENGEEFYIEVKGSTLERDGIAYFPDAPTSRGAKHLDELCKILKQNKKSILIILVSIKDAYYFSPNRDIDENFYKKFISCINLGLKVYPFKIEYNIQNKYLYLSNLIDLKIV